jgi:hypothetical protein
MRETSGQSPVSYDGAVVSPFFFSSLAPLRRARPVKHRKPRSSAAVSPLSVVRAHQWVGTPALSGFTVWLTGSVRRRPERIFFPHGVSTTDAWSGPTSRGPKRMTAVAWASTRSKWWR